jgi:hypothetical protein
VDRQKTEAKSMLFGVYFLFSSDEKSFAGSQVKSESGNEEQGD